ncbi:MAG TPA: DUF222 domain-containing protein, partial [Micrococcaceae bacterium]|nr:DUF222 domain-containing protein [Micrococcaceae bacterium]
RLGARDGLSREERLLDERSRAQVLLDTLVSACAAALAVKSLPVAGGAHPQLIVTITAAELTAATTAAAETEAAGGLGFAHRSVDAGSSGWMQFTGPAAASTITPLLCTGAGVTLLADSAGNVLDLGRTQRTFSHRQRTALTARDRGCTFPGCTIPASWCEAHHVTWWKHGGPTNIGNGALACSFHHHLIHQGHWRITMTGGIPWYTPPPWTDPAQTPTRNTYHHT